MPALPEKRANATEPRRYIDTIASPSIRQMTPSLARIFLERAPVLTSQQEPELGRFYQGAGPIPINSPLSAISEGSA
jgi:hypothetical protein